MNQFTASNGRIIVTSDEACGASTHVKIGFGEGGRAGDFTMTAAERDALREFFRAEEDERLGRWRWPALPEYVAYWHPVLQRLTVTWEPEGGSTFFKRADDLTYAGNPGRVARAYFDAHPEPKPWHRALPGESWVLVYLNEEVPAVASSSESGHIIFTASTNEGGGTEEFFTDSKHITAGRRVYPEPS